MVSIKEQLVIVYVMAADYLEKHPALAQWRESNNGNPKFTDAEVLTLAMMQNYFRTPTLSRTFVLVRANDPQAFPRCCSYKQWMARLKRLTPQLGGLLGDVAQANANHLPFYFLDAEPIPMCHPVRHGRVLLLREAGAYFGKSSKGWFFGFKLHLLVTTDGLIVNAILTPGNWNDRDAAVALLEKVAVGSVCLADRGYRSDPLQTDIWDTDGIVLVTRADAGPDHQTVLCSLRERVETTFSQLWARFATHVYSRSWEGLWNSLLLKMLDHSWSLVGLIPA